MFIIYCQECGSKNQNTSKPKFCNGCGQSFSNDNTPTPKIAKAKIKPVRKLASEIRNAKKENKLDEYENDDSQESDFDINSIEDFPVEIQGFSLRKGGKRKTLRDVILPPDQAQEPKPIPQAKVGKGYHKKAMAEYKKEAGTLRKKDS